MPNAQMRKTGISLNSYPIHLPHRARCRRQEATGGVDTSVVEMMETARGSEGSTVGEGVGAIPRVELQDDPGEGNSHAI